MGIPSFNITFNNSSTFIGAVQHNRLAVNLYLTVSLQITTLIPLFTKRKQKSRG